MSHLDHTSVSILEPHRNHTRPHLLTAGQSGSDFRVRDYTSTERIANETALRAIYPAYPVMGGIRQHPRGAETAGKACCAFDFDSQVDRVFLLEVLLISTAQRFLGAVRHEQLPPKFSSNTHLTKGVLCPENSIRSIRSCTVR